MGRRALGLTKTTVRLPVDTVAKITKVAGDKRVAGFIREAVEEKLEREAN